MATFSLQDSTTTSLTIRVTGLPSGTRVVNWYIGTSTSNMPYDDYENTSSTSCTHTYEGLDPATSYYVKVAVYDSSNNQLGVYTSTSRYKTDTEIIVVAWQLGNTYKWSNLSEEQSQYLSFGKAGYVARFTITFARSGTATFYSMGSSDTYGYLSTSSSFDETVGGPSSIKAENDDSGSGSNFKLTYNVTAGTTYYLWARLYDIEDTGTTTIYVQPPAIEIDPWDWSASNGNATTSQTKAAYTAITSGGNVSNFSYQVWNDLVNKVVEVKTEVGADWNVKYLSQSATLMTSSDKTLTAARFNSLRYNIGIHESTGLNDVFTGDKVYGWYFTALTKALNLWIDSVVNQ